MLSQKVASLLRYPAYYDRLNIWLLPGLFFLCCMTASFALSRAIYIKEFNYITNTGVEVAEMVKQSLNVSMKYRSQSLEQLAYQLSSRDAVSYEEWEGQSRLLLKNLKGLNALEKINSEFRVEWVEPYAGNEGIVGLNILFDKIRQHALKTAIENMAAMVTPPLMLKQGYQGLIIYHPVFEEKKFNGFVAGVFNISEVMEDALIDWYAAYFDIKIQDDRQSVIYKNGEFDVKNNEWINIKTISILDKKWTIEIYPKTGFINRHLGDLAYVVFIMGIIISFMILIITYYIELSLQTGKKIKKNELRLRSFIKMAPASIAMLDKDLQYVTASDRWVNAYIAGQGNIAGQSFIYTFPFELTSDACILKHIKAALNGVSSHVQEDVFHLPDHYKVWIKYEIFPWVDFDKKICGVILYLDNITEQKEVDIVKNDFISTVSHELRTPLTSVYGAVSLLQRKLQDRIVEKERNLLKISVDNCERVIALVNNMLDLNKIEAGAMSFVTEKVELCSLVNDVVSQHKIYAEKYLIQLLLRCEMNEVYALIDKNRFAQVLANLLSNAAKFSPAGSKVEVSVYYADINRVSISVRDYGPGIPIEFRESVFQKFSQADSSSTKKFSGTGLGLHISKLIMDAFSGEIFYESRMAEGTTFYLQLPIANADNLVSELQ